jgi:DNA ligase-1
MIVIIAEIINKFEREEIYPGILLLQGEISPKFIGTQFNFSLKLVIRSLVNSENELKNLESTYGEMGDIGLLLEKYASNKSSGLNIIEVYNKLKKIALISGKNSQQDKMRLFKELITKLSPLEAKFCGRIVLGKLRLGVSDKTLLESLSWAVRGDKSLKPDLEQAYGARADMAAIAYSLMFEGVETLKDFTLEVGVPVSSKLVEREKDLEKVFERMGSGLIVQPKYDGLRLQIHFDRKGFKNDEEVDMLLKKTDDVRLFSRNMGNITNMFPDVVEQVRKLPVDSVILDAEVIGYDASQDKLMPFQDTVQRKRKHGVSGKASEIPVLVFCFDVLYYNGDRLLNDDLYKRIELLREKILPQNDGMIRLAESFEVKDSDSLIKKFEEYRDLGLEGLIAKIPNGPYEPGTRNYDWIKFKVKSQQDLADNVDTVILGYYKGTGNRAKFGIGGIIVGIYNPEDDKFYSLAKVGTGFKDVDWKVVKDRLDNISVSQVPNNVVVDKTLVPDVFVEPLLVAVIEADEVSKSKLHGVGYSLRFPRFKHLRDDKSVYQTTTPDEIVSLHKL